MRSCVSLLVAICCPAVLFGQAAISAHSGLIQYISGSAFIGDQPVKKTYTNFPEIKKGDTFRTGAETSAEVLLTPGVFLRMPSNSAIRMDSVALADTQLTVLAGSAMVECDEILQDNRVTVQVGSHRVELSKANSLLRFDAQPERVAVLRGQAVLAGADPQIIKKGKAVDLSAAEPILASVKTDKKDALYLFSKERSADSAYATGVLSSGLYRAGYTCRQAGWYPMPTVGMYAYQPCNGAFTNPFGFTMYGLNYGNLWAGPGFYVPPALYAGAGRNLADVGAANAYASTQGGTAAASMMASPNGANHRTKPAMNPPGASVPVFSAGPGGGPQNVHLPAAAYAGHGNAGMAAIHGPTSPNLAGSAPLSAGGGFAGGGYQHAAGAQAGPEPRMERGGGGGGGNGAARGPAGGPRSQ